MWNKFTYFFKRKYQQIQRVIDFLPLIWKGYDFDYIYSIELFKKQLQRIANVLETKPIGSDAKIRAQKIRTAIRLIDKVYSEEYYMEFIHKLEQMYGEDVLDWDTISVGKDRYKLKYKYEEWDNAEEITKMERKLMIESREKQKRAHKLLWRFIEHNIQYWWD